MIIFLNVNSKPIEIVQEDTLVIDCKMIGSFCNFAGQLMIEGLTDACGTPAYLSMNQPSKLLFEYKQENEASFAAIISEWDKRILPCLFNETVSDNQCYEFPMPMEYAEWLCQHIDGIFSEAGNKLQQGGNMLQLPASKLQKKVMNKVFDMLEYNILNSKKDIKWFTISDERISKDSAFVKVVEDKLRCISFLNLEAYKVFDDSQRIAEEISERDTAKKFVEEETRREKSENTENVGTEKGFPEEFAENETETIESESSENVEPEKELGEEFAENETETIESESLENVEPEKELGEEIEENEAKNKARIEFKKRIPNILTFNANGVVFDMMPVDGGTFMMGATREQIDDAWDGEIPKHRVTLSSYYIGELVVTQALWQAVMGSNPSQKRGDNLPVEKVSWNDCQSFITKLNEICSSQLFGKSFALPTESQWEFAARGGKKSCGYKYSGSDNIDDVAWYHDNSNGILHAVGTKSPNELGLYDMSGNIEEWCSDWYDDYDSYRQSNPTGPSEGTFRVHRGGNLKSDAMYCRVSYRNSFVPDYKSSYLGFRIVLC